MSQLVKAIEIYIAKTFSGKQKDNQLFQARKRLFVYEGNKEETPFISLYKYIAELQALAPRMSYVARPTPLNVMVRVLVRVLRTST